AVAVDRALDVRGALLDGGQRARYAAPGVVMAVDAGPGSERDKGRYDGGHRARDAVRKRSPVGVAAGDRIGSGFGGGRNASERVRRVVGVAVEEVHRVVDDPLALGNQERDRLRDHAEVLVAVDLDDLLQVQAPGLADDRADRRSRVG